MICRSESATIVTLDYDPQKCLTSPSQDIKLEKTNLEEAQKTITLLKSTLKPFLPAAGLAAPQIGINQNIFIFSWDRSEAQQIAVINPSFEAISEEKDTSWEGCFSLILGDGPYKIVNIARYKKIKVKYINEFGQPITQILEGFAARVFQHEYDHLKGIVTIHHQEAEIKTFESKEEAFSFMDQVKESEAINYIRPVDVL